MTSAVEFQAFEENEDLLNIIKNTHTCMNEFDFHGRTVICNQFLLKHRDFKTLLQVMFFLHKNQHCTGQNPEEKTFHLQPKQEPLSLERQSVLRCTVICLVR